MGPGHRHYITPRVLQEIENSQVLIGGKRILSSIDTKDKEIYYLGGDLEKILNILRENAKSKTIALLVSGDTGFYSILSFLKRHFPSESLEVTPGISSMQYMFAKIGETWEDAYLSSVHGRDLDIIQIVKEYSKVGLLTDQRWSPQRIAQEVLQAGITGKKIYVGEKLSYGEEAIICATPEEIAKRQGYQMCVVVIMDE